MSGWPGQKVGGGAPVAAPVAQPAPQGGLPARPVFSVPDPQRDIENQRKDYEASLKAADEQRAQIKFQQEQQDREQRGGADTSESEKTAAFLATRVANGLRNLTTIEGGQSPEILGSIVGAVSETAGNYVTSEPRQRVEAAQRDVLDAALTLGTGAAYTAEQLEGYRRSYFPQLGDSQATIDDKRQRLRVLLEAAKVKAGAAAPAIDEALTAAYGGPSTGEAVPQTEGNAAIQAAFDRGASKQELLALAQQLGVSFPGGEARLDEMIAFRDGGGQGATFIPQAPQEDPRVKQLADEWEARNGPAGLTDLATQGITLGFADEAGAVGSTVGRLLRGETDVAGNYQLFTAVERELVRRARERTGAAGTAAELIGGGAGVRAVGAGAATVRGALGEGALIGGTAGFGYGEGTQGSLAGAAGGAALGGALGAGVQRLANRGGGGGGGPSGGTRAADNVAAAQRFGMDISVGDAGGMSPKIVERMLDVQPGSGSVMNAARETLQGQMVNAVDNVAGGFGATTSFRGMGEAGQSGVKAWRERFDDVASKAYDAIPIKPEADATISGTIGALDELTNKITSNPQLAAMLEDKRLAGYLEALRGKVKNVSTGILDASGNPITREVKEGGSLSWNDLKQLRSRIGEEIGQQILGEGTMKSDLRRLYAALSSDMEATARAQGPAALKRFERANDLYKAGQERLERVWKSLLGPDGERTPEAAAAVIQRISREGKSSGDLRMLGELRKSTAKTGEWGQISNGIIRLLGQPANSEGREFAAQTFFRNYADMSPEAKNLLFGGENKALRQNLDEFSRVIGLVAQSGGTRNTSNTAMGLAGLGGLSVGGIPVLAAQALFSFGAAKAWTNPKFVRWATGYSKMLNGASKAGGQISPKAHASQMQALSRVAAAEPVIAADALGLQRQLQMQFQQGALPLAAEGQSERAGSNTTGPGTQ